MAIYLDDIKSMRLTKTKFFLPIYEEDKKKHSAVFLLSPNINSSINIMNNPLIVNPSNIFQSYYLEKNISFVINEHFKLVNDSDIILEDYNTLHTDCVITEEYIASNIDGHRMKAFFPDYVEKEIFKETDNLEPTKLRQLLYAERIRSQKQILGIYNSIKEKVPYIKYTYVNYKMYKERNIFIDWSYYTEVFFKNNIYKLDKGINLYLDFMNKFLNDSRLDDNGYKVKTVFVPVNDWITDKDTAVWDYTKNINPISVIYRLFRLKSNILKEKWKNLVFVFMSDKAYFKISFDDFDNKQLPQFTTLITKLILNDTDSADSFNSDSSKVITHKLIDKIEKSGIEINNLTGDIANAKTDEDKKKAKLVQHIKNTSDRSESEEDALDNLDDKESGSSDGKWVKELMIDLQSEENVTMNKTRVARMTTAYNSFMDKRVDKSTVRDLISKNKEKEDLPIDTIPIDSANEEWQDVKFSNFNKEYNLESDILAILENLNDKSNPIVIIGLTKEDTSTSEDYIETYTVKMEDVNGKRFTIKLDVPKFINNRFMKLRGNLKTINGQLVLLPIIKTEEDTAQIVSSYNKIFIRRVNPAGGTKTTEVSSKLNKCLSKYKGTKLKIFAGDNWLSCSKYELPIEYRDLASNYSKITHTNGSYISFNIDEMMELTKNDKNRTNDSIPIGYDTIDRIYIYINDQNTASVIRNYLSKWDKDFNDLWESEKPSKKLSYTEASILATRIPVIVVMSYNEGLQKAMDKAGIKYRFDEKRPKNESFIKFNDGYIVYDNYKIADSLLMSGLQDCNTEDYSIKEINKKTMWLDFLDNYGGRIKADGLDNFYDCMFDPVTKEICEQYELPSDYVTALGYASGLLADTKYNRHADITGNRLRTNELVAGYMYKIISMAYGDYRNQLKRNKKDATMTVKQSALLDAILVDNTCSDLSIINPLLEAEANNTVSFKGLSGMNSDRSYGQDKRLYDESMFGTLGLVTGFSANAGLTRQATVNASIKGVRGIINPPKKGDINTLNSMSIYEAITPYATTHDEPMRSAMGFIQTNKHQMRVLKSSPNLITTGMDEALPYMTSDIFSHKFKGKKGKVVELTDEYIIYSDEYGSNHYVSLKETVMKNSDGGFFVTVKLDPCVKKGQVLKYNDILAYDKSSYSKPIGTDKGSSNISYNAGTMAKLAIMPTDEAYEDSAIISSRLSKDMTSFYCVKKEKSLDKNTNVYKLVEPGTRIEEGEPLIIFQNAFEEKDANDLLKTITDDDVEAISDLGRIHIRSKLTGVVQDVKIYRTCEIDELSPSLKKIVTKYESGIKKQKSVLTKYKIEGKERLEPDYKLDPTGKLKGTLDGVLIEFYIKAEDMMGVGDKMVYYTAVKGVIKDIMPKGKEPYTDFRDKEPIDTLLTISSLNARMVTSVINVGIVNKILIELDRQCKEKLGIEWKNLEDM